MGDTFALISTLTHRDKLRRHRDDCLRTRMLDRINSVVHQRTRSAGLLPGFNEAHVGERAEPHVTRAAVQRKSVNPGSRPARLDLQVKTGAVGMQFDVSERADLCFSEFLNKARHEKSPCGPYPRSSASIRLTLKIATLFRAIWTLWKGFLSRRYPSTTPVRSGW